MACDSLNVCRSASLHEACRLFLDDIGAWAYSCVERYREQPVSDGHDQLTYTTGWEPFLLTRPSERLFTFLNAARRDTADHFHRAGLWRHGYWCMQEAHHGTEHFELFLGLLARLRPDDAETRAQVEDAVEHVGNWSGDVPPWYDEGSGLFRSLYFGTDGVRPEGHELNMPDHLRCVNLLLLAYDINAKRRYLDLALEYGRCWADAIIQRPDRLPVGLSREGTIYELSETANALYRSFAGMAGRLDTDLDRAENLMASGAVQMLLRLWRESGEAAYRDACRRIVGLLVDELGDVDAGPAAAAVRLYREAGAGTDFDDHVREAGYALPRKVTTLSLETEYRRTEREGGVGKRIDLPVWTEDGRPRQHNPILCALAAEIADDEALAAWSVDLARTYFRLALTMLPDGRHHGCAAKTVNAVARGHGRNNHAGMTTAVLLPLLRRSGMLPRS